MPDEYSLNPAELGWRTKVDRGFTWYTQADDDAAIFSRAVELLRFWGALETHRDLGAEVVALADGIEDALSRIGPPDDEPADDEDAFDIHMIAKHILGGPDYAGKRDDPLG